MDMAIFHVVCRDQLHASQRASILSHPKAILLEQSSPLETCIEASTHKWRWIIYKANIEAGIPKELKTEFNWKSALQHATPPTQSTSRNNPA